MHPKSTSPLDFTSSSHRSRQSIRSRSLALSSLILGLVAACAPLPDDDAVLEGPLESLTPQQLRLFAVGDRLFNKVFTASEGLGPTFNAPSCIHCHPGDGAGHPSTALQRFGLLASDGSFDPLEQLGGPQLQNRALAGFEPEFFPAEANVSVTLIAPPVTGLGYLEAVPDETLIALQDPYDADGDGVSGRVHWLPATESRKTFAAIERRADTSATRFVEHSEGFIGRFGRKGAILSLYEQTAVALRDDIGITSSALPEENHSIGLLGLTQTSVNGVDITDGDLNAIVFYLKALRVPPRRNQSSPSVIRGEQVFRETLCVSCHVESLTTGPSPLAALNEQVIFPYSDLLLHDMGEELDSGYTEGSAMTSEWRTAPLWGFGLRRDAQGGKLYLLHDGRAESVAEAIEYHGGEAARSRELYRALSKDDRDALDAFLESL